MPESRVLIIDSDEGRGEQMAAVLHFIDCNPVVMSDAAEIDLKKQTPQDWVAVVIGQHSADKPWDKFIQWPAVAADARASWPGQPAIRHQ